MKFFGWPFAVPICWSSCRPRQYPRPWAAHETPEPAPAGAHSCTSRQPEHAALVEAATHPWILILIFVSFATTCSTPLAAYRSETQQRRTGELLLSLHRFSFWACCLEKGPFEYKHLVTFYIYVPCTSDQRLHVGRISPSLISMFAISFRIWRAVCVEIVAWFLHATL